MTIGGVSGVMTVAQVTGGLDIETFMMMVQAERANNLESQMAQQINEIKERQARIAELNQLLADLRAAKPAGEDRSVKGDLSADMVEKLKRAGVTLQQTDPNQPGYVEDIKAGKEAQLANLEKELQAKQAQRQDLEKKLNELSEEISKTPNNFTALDLVKKVQLETQQVAIKQQITLLNGQMSSLNAQIAQVKSEIAAITPDKQFKATGASFDKWIEELKGKLDALNNTAQLDMIRLQSLSNKRNEAFEQLTNFIQKIAKSKESVIGNMR